MQQELTVKPEIRVTVRREIGRVVNPFIFMPYELNARVTHLS